MSQSTYDEAAPEDKEHFMRCGGCGEWIDKRNLDEIFSHESRRRPRKRGEGREAEKAGRAN